uniref:Myelin and lymphocyte protein n=1 Tax=Leptobrachium leishanense TaxID=445787 RepID=A0A8C5WKT0_9ANUR
METKNNAVYADVSVANVLPSGLKLFKSFPDVLMIPELIFGGLVWILIAASRVPTPLLQGWTMFVSVTLFIGTFVSFILYIAQIHKGNPIWTAYDAAFHSISALFYLSASVLEAASLVVYYYYYTRVFQLNIAAVVFAFIATSLYVVHAVFSLLRWKKNP